MEYEVYEPDREDEYYDQMLSAAMATMFCGGWNGPEDCNGCVEQPNCYPAAS